MTFVKEIKRLSFIPISSLQIYWKRIAVIRVLKSCQDIFRLIAKFNRSIKL